MALADTTGPASFDITANTNQLDLRQELAELIKRDNMIFLSKLGVSETGQGGKPVSQTTHYWNEDKLVPRIANSSDDADGILTASGSDTSLNVVAGQGVRFKVGTLFQDKATGKSEVIQVAAVSTDTLTIVRGFGTTSAEAHAQNFDIHIISHPAQEDQDVSGDHTQERSSKYNYTQIFQKSIRIPYTREYITNNGIPSEFAHQIAYRLKEEMRELNSAVITSVISADAGGSSSYRAMGGLWDYITRSSGNVTTTTESFDEGVVNTLFNDIYNDTGGIDNGFILMGPALRRIMSTFHQSARRTDFDSTTVGYVVNKFITDLGYELEVILDPAVMPDRIIIGDKSRISVLALQGDAMRFEEVAKLGRSFRGMVTGQYTVEILNALEAFGAHNNLS